MDKTNTTSSQELGITREHGLHLLYHMIRIRRFEEKAAELYSALKIRGFLHLYDGEEAVAVGIMQSLKNEDAIFATYREHGHALVRGISANAIMAELFGKQNGCSRGRGGSMHIFDKETNFYGGNAIVGGHLPLAVGMGLSIKLQKQERISVCFFGEGAVAEGEFHESMNLAALWKLPVLFVCENNSYAMGTALKLSESMTEISQKAAGYGVETNSINGMDVLEVEKEARHAIDYIRENGQPFFLECKTYRFRAHSMFDAELYREKKEVETWKKKGPIITFIQKLKDAQMIHEDDIQQIETQVKVEVGEAVAFAEAGEWEPVSDLTRFVYSENSPS